MRKGKIFLCLFCIYLVGRVSFAGEKKEESPLLASKALKLSGFTQFQYSHFDEGLDSFLIRRARLSLGGEILKNIRYTLQMDVSKSPVLLDTQVEFDLPFSLTLRIGQFKVPFSQENLTSSSALDIINRSQTVEQLCPGRDIGSQGRDIGAVLFGKFSQVEWTLGVFNGAGINKADTNEQKDLAARFVFKPLDILTLAGAFYKGKHSPLSGALPLRRDRTGLEIFVKKSPFSLKGEYILAKDGETSKSGYYLQAGYFFILEKLEAIVKYDSFDKNRDILLDRSDIFTLGVNWFFSEKTKLQANCEWHKEENGSRSNFVVLAQFQAGF